MGTMRMLWGSRAAHLVHEPAIDVAQYGSLKIISAGIDAHGKHRAGCMKQTQRLVGVLDSSVRGVPVATQQHRQSSHIGQT